MVETNIGWYLLRSLTALAVVIALILLVAALTRRYLNLLPTSRRGGSRLEILEITSLDRQHRIAIVATGEKRFLVGFGNGSVATLGSWNERDAEPESAGTESPVVLERVGEGQ